MTIEHVLAVIPVRDLSSAVLWYERLLGRPADNRPMDTLAEWQVTLMPLTEIPQGCSSKFPTW